jgi:predicted phage tail protein
MKKVFLHGEIAKVFGSQWELNVQSPRESISALMANNPEIEKYLFSKQKEGVVYTAGYDYMKEFSELDDLNFKSNKDIHIFPAPTGSAQMLGGMLTTGLTSFAGAFINAKISKKMNETFGQEDTSTLVAQSKSFLMQGGENRYQQGTNVPLGYGRMKIGSNVISATTLNYEYDSKNGKIRNYGDNGSIFAVLPEYKWDEFGGSPRPPAFSGQIMNSDGAWVDIRLRGEEDRFDIIVLRQYIFSDKLLSVAELVEAHNERVERGDIPTMKISVDDYNTGIIVPSPSSDGQITISGGFGGYETNPVTSTVDFDGIPEFKYYNKHPGFDSVVLDSNFGSRDAIYGQYEGADKTARRVASNVVKKGNGLTGYLYYTYNYGKGVDVSLLENWSGKGNWRPTKHVTDDSYVSGLSASKSSFVCLQSMPVQETTSNIINEKLDIKNKKFYPLLYTEGLSSNTLGRALTVGERWKNGRKKDGVGWYSLESVSIYKAIDLLCEGPIGGFSNKNGDTITYDKTSSFNKDFLQSVYLNDTPVMDYKPGGVTSKGYLEEERVYNINEFDIEVASDSNNVIGSSNQELLDSQYVFIANSKNINQQLFGPRIETKTLRQDIYDFIDEEDPNVETGGLYEVQDGLFIPINQDSVFKYINPQDRYEKDPEVFYNSLSYNLYVKSNNVNQKKLEELEYNIDNIGTGYYRAWEEGGFYDRDIYSDRADNPDPDLYYDSETQKFFMPYNGWDESRSLTFDDYPEFYAEYVVPGLRTYQEGDLVRARDDDGGWKYFEMGKYAHKFKGKFQDKYISTYEPGDIVMANSEELDYIRGDSQIINENVNPNVRTDKSPLFLITGSAPDRQIEGSALGYMGLQIITMKTTPGAGPSVSLDFHYVLQNAIDSLKKINTTEFYNEKISQHTSYISSVVKKEVHDITPNSKPELWERILIKSPDEIYIPFSLDDPTGLIQDSKGEYISNMYGNTSVIQEVADETYSKDYFYGENNTEAQAIDEFKKFINEEKKKNSGNVNILINSDIAPLEDLIQVTSGSGVNVRTTTETDQQNVFFSESEYVFNQVNSRWEQEGVIDDSYTNQDSGEEFSTAGRMVFKTNLTNGNDDYYAGFQIELSGEVRNILDYKALDPEGNQVGEVRVDEEFTYLPQHGDSFKIYKSFTNTEKLAITGYGTFNGNLYAKIQERERNFDHSFLVKWVFWEKIGESFVVTRLQADEESDKLSKTRYLNIADKFYSIASVANQLTSTIKEEEHPVTHTVVNPLVEQLYVGLQMDQLFFIYPGDEVEIEYKIGRIMWLIFAVFMAVQLAGVTGSFGLAVIIPVFNFGFPLFVTLIAIMGIGAAWIGTKSTKFKIGTRIENSGELWPNRAKFRIRYGNVGEELYSTDVYFYGIVTSSYRKDVKIFLPPNPNNKDRIIKVYKLNRERNPVEEGEQVYRYKQKMLLSSITEITPTRLNYPNSVVVGTRVNARDIGSSVPNRKYHIKMKKVAIPSNYNPETKVYRGNWNGLFKGEDFDTGYVPEEEKSWTDNPAWCLHDLMSNKSYGGGKFGIKYENIDKWTLYKVAKYCDEFIPTGYTPKYQKRFFKVSPLNDKTVIIFEPSDFNNNFITFLQELGNIQTSIAMYYADNNGGFFEENNKYDRRKIVRVYREYFTSLEGGDSVFALQLDEEVQYEAGYCVTEFDHPIVEPRYTVNALIMQEQNAFKIINEFAAIFRTYIYWSAGAVNFFQDQEKEALMFFNNTNISKEGFSYKSTSKVERNNICKMRFLDKFNEFKPKIEVSEEREFVIQNNINDQNIDGFGITSRGQAKRAAQFITKTDNLETEMVQFKTDTVGAYLRPGDIIEVLDNKRTVGRFSGKIKNVRFEEGGKLMNIYIDYPIPSYINPAEDSSWKNIKVYDLSEYETMQSLDLAAVIGEADDDTISNMRKTQFTELRVVGLSENKEKLTVIANIYEYIPGEFTFREAIKDAQFRGGELASITSDTESYISKIAMPQDDDVVAWIGGFDNDSSDILGYEWLLPKSINPEITYFNWMPEYSGFESSSEDLDFFSTDPVPSNVNQLDNLRYTVEQDGEVYLIKDAEGNVVSQHPTESEASNQVNSLNQVEHGGFLAIKGSLNNNKHAKWISIGPNQKHGYLLERKLDEELTLTRYRDIVNKSFIIEDAVNLAKPKTYRVLNIVEESNTTYKIEASQYNPEKFREIEENLKLENPVSPVIFTERRIQDQEDNIELDFQEVLDESGEVIQQTIKMAFYTEELPPYFKIAYYFGYEVLGVFEVRREQLDRRYADQMYLHEYILSEVYDKSRVRADVFLIY